ncbi:rod shape-determining protein MreD [Peptostreptococcus sp. MV1]|uniref:rod shape-determining protein MreD n=1 Tax=Peptostreptococcus sp. MV1 TaxID=1219626 RepID=UPI00050E1DD4|nr:rod shape-determining protein MreD [Peptostreptococcus sp. MV1]KGF13381.1 rod shape-determining protein MreD [Peptostreptococcus sp. MV1]
MKNILVFLIGLFLIFLEAFFTNHISSFVSIDLLLVYIVLISLYLDKNYAIVVVGLLGLISDLVVGGVIGITAVLFMGSSYFISTVEKSIFKDKKVIVSFLVFVISLVYSVINAVVSAIFFVPVPLVLVLIKGLILIPFLNVVVAFLAYVLFGDLLMKLREE